MNAKQPSDVFVIQAGHDFLVRPATFINQGRDAVSFRNLTEHAVTVFLPWRVAGRTHQVVDLGPQGRGEDSKAVDTRELAAGAYSYAVFVAGANVFAKGESEPRIIIS